MNFSIRQYSFDESLESEIIQNHSNFLNWPLVYFLENNINKKEAYVGETTDVLTRLKTHSKSEKKQNLNLVSLIISDLFNKSATLDLESNLIRYLSADGQYSLQNGNLGISNHKYYQQNDIYSDLFKNIWNELRTLGIARHSLDYIDNSDLFKYSPYKSLSKEQVSGLKIILDCLMDDNAKTSLIQGGAGTGKSILAIFLFKLLKTDLKDFNYADFDEEAEQLFQKLKKVKEKYGELNMALVIPMTSFRKTLKNVFKNIKGLSKEMVIGPSDIVKFDYDLLIVDEGHRLRKRQNLTNYKSFDDALKYVGLNPIENDELDLIEKCSNKAIIFYDSGQSIKPTDVDKEKFSNLKNLESTRVEKLTTQFRVKGGNQYVNLVHRLFNDSFMFDGNIDSNVIMYDLKVFSNLNEMILQINEKEKINGLSRLVAGFAWEYKSKKDRLLYDIEIDNISLRWNSTEIDWVNSLNAINEVGCIHTTQGYDLNYVGVIIGPELDYDFEFKKFVIYKEKYKDKNGKNSIKDDDVLKEYILNIYKTILLRGIEGTYIYVCNKNLREYLTRYIPIYEVDNINVNDFEILLEPNEYSVAYYDLRVSAGSFSELQNVEDLQFISMPDLVNREDYFVCKVVGESMNKIIPNGSLCLFKKYFGGSRNGLITLVESTEIYDSEFGSSYTIKEYNSKKTFDNDGWKHEEIILKPLSTESFDSIKLREDELVNFKVIGVFVKVLNS